MAVLLCVRAQVSRVNDQCFRLKHLVRRTIAVRAKSDIPRFVWGIGQSIFARAMRGKVGGAAAKLYFHGNSLLLS